jgi:hypothetical protein
MAWCVQAKQRRGKQDGVDKARSELAIGTVFVFVYPAGPAIPKREGAPLADLFFSTVRTEYSLAIILIQ